MEIAAIFVRRDLLVVAFDNGGADDFSNLTGQWLDVPIPLARQYRILSNRSGGAPHMIDAIKAAPTLTLRVKTRALFEQQQRFVDRVGEFALDRPGKVSIAVSAHPSSEPFRHLLSDFRRRKLWSKDGQGLLARLAFHISNGSTPLAEFMFQFLGEQQLGSRPGVRMLELANAFAAFDQGVFEWHRRSDDYYSKMVQMLQTSFSD